MMKGPKGWDLEPTTDGRNERTRFSSQPQPAQRVASLPWEKLPKKRLSRGTDGEDHRKIMDKMMGTGRLKNVQFISYVRIFVVVITSIVSWKKLGIAVA